jgi:hypothetical protein
VTAVNGDDLNLVVKFGILKLYSKIIIFVSSFFQLGSCYADLEKKKLMNELFFPFDERRSESIEQYSQRLAR